jgi:hypothetical protein
MMVTKSEIWASVIETAVAGFLGFAIGYFAVSACTRGDYHERYEHVRQTVIEARENVQTNLLQNCK